MKNINEQVNRIKQLFTEERLHGNLVEDDNDKVLTEQEKQKKKYNRGVERAKRKLERKLKKSKSKEEMDKAQEKFAQKTSELWSDYSKNPKAFNTKKLLFKNGDLKLYGHKDKSSELMLVSLGKGVSAEEGSKGATELIKSYFKEKFAKDNEDIEVTLITNDKFKSGKEYVVFSVIDNSDLIPSQENKSTDGPTEKPTGKPEEKTSEKPTEKPTEKPKEKVKSSVKPPEKSKGDFTKPLQKLGGAQKGFTYELVSNNKAVKKDGNGEVVATYIRESKFNKKSLFESALRFDLKNTIIENWKWVEGDKTFSDSMSKKFDDAIAQIGSGSSSAADKSTKSDVEGAGAENTELEEEWKNFPCVYNNPNKKASMNKEDGTTSFLINNVHFFNNGRCMDAKTKEMRNYKCVDGKIVLSDKKPVEKTDKMWDNYPCVKNNPKSKEVSLKDGSSYYKIGDIIYYNNGKAKDLYHNFMRNYKCVDGKIVFFDKKQEKETKPKQSESYAEVKKWLAKEGKDFLVGDFAETFPKIYDEMLREVMKDESFEDISSYFDPVGVSEFTDVFKTLSKYDKEGVIPAFLKVYEKEYNDELLDDVESTEPWKGTMEEKDIQNRIISILEKYNDSWWDKLSNWFKNL